jgi:hypothetical protein
MLHSSLIALMVLANASASAPASKVHGVSEQLPAFDRSADIVSPAKAMGDREVNALLRSRD